jgi:putative acyl-CoA dehydrogenase
MIEVANQPPPLEPYNLLGSDHALREAVAREGASWALDELAALGAAFGSAEVVAQGIDANRNLPQLRAFDRSGNRIDEVEFHPAWHALLGRAVAAGLHSSPWAAPKPGAHVARAAGTYMMMQIESGIYCPIAMTYGAAPTLRLSDTIAAEWLPRVFRRDYDPRCRPASEKGAALIGMGMTEIQGGSDLRTNVSRAVAVDAARRFYRLTGHKWFLSAPMCDAFLVLAQTDAGPTCFLVPRWTPDRQRNAIHILRLKDKLGNRSNASSEVEFADAHAERVGEEGRGIPTIIDMSNYTRLDCAIGSSGLMRQAVAQAIHHAQHRIAFQKKLIDHDLMTNVLADLALESESATALTMRVARAYDEDGEAAAAIRRVVTPAAKFWICKRGPTLAAEAVEVLGGNGYVEDFVLARIYREMPVNSIWEGSGNVMCLDVLRALTRTPGAIEVLAGEWREPARDEPRLKVFVVALERRLAGAADDPAQARALTRDLVLALQAALLVRYAPPGVADAFCASRLGDTPGGAFGLLPPGIDCRAIVERAAPASD